MKKRRVLVLAGGGVMGMIQLPVLAKIEKLTNTKISNIYDLIVGTSVGSINGGVLATGKTSVREYINIFYEMCPKIFKKPFWRFGLFSPKYKREPFYDLFNEIVGTDKYYMRDMKTKFLSTSVNLVDGRTHYFKSWEAKDGWELAKDVIARSFAAPIYFGKLVDQKNRAVWVDGGVGVSNCPADIATVEIVRQGWYKDTVTIDILGTGYKSIEMNYNKAKKLGNFGQVLSGYMNPSDGGFARVQSTADKVYRIKNIDKVLEPLYVNYVDKKLPDKLIGLDKVKFLSEYQSIGLDLAEEVDKRFFY